MKVRKKPVVVEARLFDPESDYDQALSVVEWAGGVPNDEGFVVPTLEGHHQVTPGYYVIKGVKGEFYGCDPEIFWMTYESPEDDFWAKADLWLGRVFPWVFMAALSVATLALVLAMAGLFG